MHFSESIIRMWRCAHNKRTPQQTEASGGEKKKFLSLSWHDKSVCISTPFITSRPRQWIEFQKPINKGDVHSAWQLSQASVPLSFTHPPSLFFFPFFCKMSGKREMKIKSGEGELGEKKGSRGDETPSCSGSPFMELIKESIKARSGCVFFFSVN